MTGSVQRWKRGCRRERLLRRDDAEESTNLTRDDAPDGNPALCCAKLVEWPDRIERLYCGARCDDEHPPEREQNSAIRQRRIGRGDPLRNLIDERSLHRLAASAATIWRQRRALDPRDDRMHAIARRPAARADIPWSTHRPRCAPSSTAGGSSRPSAAPVSARAQRASRSRHFARRDDLRDRDMRRRRELIRHLHGEHAARRDPVEDPRKELRVVGLPMKRRIAVDHITGASRRVRRDIRLDPLATRHPRPSMARAFASISVRVVDADDARIGPALREQAR